MFPLWETCTPTDPAARPIAIIWLSLGTGRYC